MVDINIAHGLMDVNECYIQFFGEYCNYNTIISIWNIIINNGNPVFTSSTAQGGGGSFKDRKPVGEVGCCESGMAERSH